MQLLESEWMFISEIIYRFNSTKDFTQARKDLLDSIRILIHCDKATFFLTDLEQKNAISNPVGSDFSEELMQEYIDLQMHQDYARWLFGTTKGRTYRTAEWFPPGEREKEPYYRTYYQKCGIHYAGLLTLAYNDRFVGIICLYRDKSWQDFSDHDMFILDVLERHIAYKVYNEIFVTNEGGMDVSTYISKKIDRLADKYYLTTREKEIAIKLVEGNNTGVICDELAIAQGTLKTHIVNIYRKFGINSRAELIKCVNEV